MRTALAFDAQEGIADRYYERAKALVDACEVTREFDQPWLANRTRNGRKVSIDKRIPVVLPKCGVNTTRPLAMHELSEWLAMNDGMPYDHDTPGAKGKLTAHNDVATPLERREVERQKPGAWAEYTHEMDGYILEVDDERIEHVMPDQDLRQFAEDDRALLRKIIRAERWSGDVHDAGPGTSDPTGTMPLQARFRAEMDKRWTKLRLLVVEALTASDILGLGGPTVFSVMHSAQSQPHHARLPHANKIAGFSAWLAEAIRQTVEPEGGWMAPYLAQAAEMGVLTVSKARETHSAGSGHMAALAGAELQGIAAVVGQQATRAVAHGVQARSRPAQIARDVAARIKAIGVQRSRAMVAYLTVKAFNDAILDELRALGHTHVGIIPERAWKPKQQLDALFDAARNTPQQRHSVTGQFRARSKGERSIPQKRHSKTGKFIPYRKKPSQYAIRKATQEKRRLEALGGELAVQTAEDDLVCQACQDAADNGPYTLDEAQGLVPLHVNCRCSLYLAEPPEEAE